MQYRQLCIPSGAIMKFIRRMEQADVLLHGFELRFQGRIQAEGYYAPFQKGEMHRMYSVSKSIVSLAIGLLEAEGKLSLDDHIMKYFPDKVTSNTDGRLLRLTIGDMLRMSTCHRRTTYIEGEDKDWASTFFTVPPTHEPGTVFSYDTSCSQVLGVLCQRCSGMGLLAFLHSHLFELIGATDPKVWLADPSGTPQGGTGLMMSLRDLGKVAQMLLDGGLHIVPRSYIDRASGKQIDTIFQSLPEETYGYGYQFWRTRQGYAMFGMGAQLALLCPQKQIALCTIGDTRMDPYGMQKIYDAFYEEIYSSEPVQDDSAADREALDAMLLSLTVSSVPHFDEYRDVFAEKYQMNENAPGLSEVAFTREEIRFVWADQTHVFPYRLGEVLHQTLSHWGTRCLISAGFGVKNTLRLRCHLIGEAPCGLDILFVRKGDTLTMQMRCSSHPFTKRYEGFVWGNACSSFTA